MSPRGPWLQTHSGACVELLEPDPETMTLEDAAHGIAHLARFTGATSHFYSVAEHSIRVSRLVYSWTQDLELAAQALIHDAHEYITGDVASPIKIALGPAWADFEARIMFAARRAWRQPEVLHRLVKDADVVVLDFERRELLGPAPHPWDIEGRVQEILERELGATGADLHRILEHLARQFIAGGSPWPWRAKCLGPRDAYQAFVHEAKTLGVMRA